MDYQARPWEDDSPVICYVGLLRLEYNVYDIYKMPQVNFFDAAASLGNTKQVAVAATTSH
jgi:hypothetical protein